MRLSRNSCIQARPLTLGTKRRPRVIHAKRLVSVGLIAFITLAGQARTWAQDGFGVQSGVSAGGVNIPETNLVPIAPPPGGFAPPSGFAPPNGFAPANGGLNSTNQFDPYATTPGSTFTSPPGAGRPSTFPPAGSFTAPAINGLPGPAAGGSFPGPAAGSIAAPGNGSVLGAPVPNLSPSTGQIQPSPPGGSLFSRIFSRPDSTPAAAGFGPQFQGQVVGGPTGPTFGPPVFTTPPPGGLGDPYAQPYSGGFQPAPQFPSSVYPQSSPTTLFPEGIFSGGAFATPPAIADTFRLFQGPRLRHTFILSSDDPHDLQTNTTDVSAVFALPNFLYSTQPLYIVPSFSLQLWDGPAGLNADLPSRAYGAFLDIGWFSDPNQMVSTELGVRVGVFTDFDTYNSDSIRVLGKGLFAFRTTPTSTFKLGVYYLDRNDIKIVPAVGFLCQPNPFTRYDIFFPQPKLAKYWRTIGTQDVWWYLAGDYGGGSWTIKRANQTEDSIDINEIQALVGIEWGRSDLLRMGRRTAFFELGYAFEREVEYRFNGQDNFKPDDGILFRLGIGY